MFDYNSSETIINGLYLSDGVTPQWKVLSAVVDTSATPVEGEDPFINYFGGDKALQVTRIAKYIDKFITQVWRNPYTTTAYETAVLTVPSGGITGGVVYRLSIDAILDQGSQSAEYSRWAIHKGKPYLIEFSVDTTISNTTNAATEIVTQLKRGLKNPDLGDLELTITSSGAAITIKPRNAWVHFKTISIEELYPVGSGTSEDLEGDVKTYLCAFDDTTQTPSAGTAVITVTGDPGFGSYDWMIRNLRVPTVEQTRFMGTFTDELPRAGSYYTQFVLEYEKSREITGTNAIGAPATSKTRHTFFVVDTGASDNTNPAYKFYQDIQTVLGTSAEDYVTNIPDSDAGSSYTDGILNTTTDNYPLV